MQGALTTPPAMERTFIAAADRHTDFYRDFRSALGGSGVTLVDSATDATATFTILFDQTGQRVASGSYVYRLTTDSQQLNKVMVLVK